LTELKILGPDQKALKREKIVDVLWALQQQRGFIDDEAVKLAAVECDLTPQEVDEVATFYNLLLRRPAGKRQIYVCDSISCEIRGAESLIAEIERQLGAKLGDVTSDGEFGLLPIVCLGHCEKAPCLLANENVHGPCDTSADAVRALLQRVRDERRPAQG
jgi:NADH-quinone oxidoreductase subunit E